LFHYEGNDVSYMKSSFHVLKYDDIGSRSLGW